METSSAEARLSADSVNLAPPSGMDSEWRDMDAAPAPRASAETSWDLAFFGLLAYVVVEYTRLPAMYPILQPLNLGKLTVIMAALSYLAGAKPKQQRLPAASRVQGMLIVVLLAVGFSALLAEHVDYGLEAYIDVVRWGIVYFILSAILNSAWRIRVVMFVFLLVHLKMAQFVIRSYQQAASLTWLSEMNRVAQGVGAGSTGFFSNSADLGVAMCVVWPIAICLLFTKLNTVYRLVAIACSIACLGAILLCGSRGAVVGAVAVALVAWVRSPKKLAAAVMVALLGIGIWVVLPDASKQRFQSAQDPEQDKTAHHRLLLWGAGLRMFSDHPFLGVGLANFPSVRLEQYPIDDPRSQYIASVPHSTYIEAISELGLGGTVPIVMLLVFFFSVNSQTRKHMLKCGPDKKQSFEFCLSNGLDLALIGYLASGAFVAVLWYPHIWVLLGLSVGLYRSAHRIQPEKSANPEPEQEADFMRVPA